MSTAQVERLEGTPRPVLLSRTSVGPLSQSLGKAHYSYGFAAHAFSRMFKANGVPVTPVVNPEHFKSAIYAQTNGLEPGEHLHLVFRNSADLRPIAGAYNVACFAWEFDVLKADGVADEYIVEDQVRMLRACDEVWVPCRFTERVLRHHGVTRVRTIPAPIFPRPLERPAREIAFEELGLFESTPLVTSSAGDEAFFVQLANTYTAPLASQRRMRTALKPGGKIFLCVCNPYDKRKNITSLIEGFLMATQGRDDVVLLIKLVTSGMFEPPSGYLFHQMRVLFGIPHCIKEESVLLMSGHLSDEQMDDLYGGCDYYLSTSIAEGQNLPLLEAMSAGCVPVTTSNTAMRDYVTDDNSVVIEEGRYSGLISGLAADVTGKRVSVDYADRFAVAAAVGQALDLTPESYARKAIAARETVARGYAPEVVYERVVKALAGACPAVVLPPWSTAAAGASGSRQTESAATAASMATS